MLTNKTTRIELRRVFILRELPEPLTRASEHLQFFDNFIENTRLCLRSIRAPHTKEWAYVLEQREPHQADDLSMWEVSEIHLNEAEHHVFEQFEGREVQKNERVETNELRFNRYFHEGESYRLEVDFFLNPLWGVLLGTVHFETIEDLQNFEMPAYAVSEVTQNENFLGRNLIGKTFADVQQLFQKM